MTDKYIPASKLLALLNEYDDSVHDLPQAIRALIDEAPEVESVEYNKTELNGFVYDLYDKKMKEGKHGHYETMFSVVHAAIKRVASHPPSHNSTKLVRELVKALEDDAHAASFQSMAQYRTALIAKVKGMMG